MPRYAIGQRLPKIIVAGIALSAQIAFGQGSVFLENARIVDTTRYADIKGSPYLFERFRRAEVILPDGRPVSGVAVNFNGYTGRLEVRQGDAFIEMDDAQFMAVRIPDTDTTCGQVLLSRFQHPRLSGPYMLIMSTGDRYALIREFRVRLEENAVHAPGKTEIFKSFSAQSGYFVMEKNQLTPVRLNRKNALERFAFPEAEKFIQDEKLDLRLEKDWCRLLRWAEFEHR